MSEKRKELFDRGDNVLDKTLKKWGLVALLASIALVVLETTLGGKLVLYSISELLPDSYREAMEAASIIAYSKLLEYGSPLLGLIALLTRQTSKEKPARAVPVKFSTFSSIPKEREVGILPDDYRFYQVKKNKPTVS